MSNSNTVSPEQIRQLVDADAHLVLCRPHPRDYEDSKVAFISGWIDEEKRPNAEQAIANVQAGGKIGVIPSSIGLVAVDVDLKFDQGKAARALVVDTLREPLAVAKSPGGGGHMYYRWNGDETADGQSAWKFGDIRASRGYVCIYDADALLYAVEQCGMAEPIDHRRLPRVPPYRSFTGKLLKAVESERNNTLNTVAFRLAQEGMLDNAIDELKYVASCIGLSADEIAKTLKSARKGAAKSPTRQRAGDDPLDPQTAALVDVILERHPQTAQRGRVVKELQQRGVGRSEAAALAVEAIPDTPTEDQEEAPLITSGADMIKGVTLDMTPMLAPGLAYAGRAVLVHAQRGQGKTTLLAWLAARATVEGRRVLVIGDDDQYSWQARMTGFGARHDLWSYGRASRLAPAGQLEKALADGLYDWVIVDNWRTWGLACGISKDGGFGNTDAAAVPVQRLVDLVDDTAAALTIVGNEGHHDQTRSRDSIVVEDACHAVRKLSLDEGRRITTVKPGRKTRVGIDTLTRNWTMREDESGMDLIDIAEGGDGGGGNGNGGGGLYVDDPQSVMTRRVQGYLMHHAEGVSLRQAAKEIEGRWALVIATVKAVGIQGGAGRWYPKEAAPVEPLAGVARTPEPLPPATPATPLPVSVARPMGNGAATPATPLPVGVAQPIEKATRATPPLPTPNTDLTPATPEPDNALEEDCDLCRHRPEDSRVRLCPFCGRSWAPPAPAVEDTPAHAEPWHTWPDGVLDAVTLSERIALAEQCGATVRAFNEFHPQAWEAALALERDLADPEKRPAILAPLGEFDPPADPWDWPMPAAWAALHIDPLVARVN